MENNSIQNIDQYISTFPNSTQKLLQQIRKVIAKAAPKATETIKYAMPTFDYFGNLVHFAAYKNHLGFYPAPSGLRAFQDEINKYPNSKGAVQFPLDKPLPLKLITDIVKFRVLENENKAALKSVKKTCPQGHQYFKSSLCPTCPVCEAQKKSQDGFMSGLSAPAQRALINQKITSLKKLSNYTENKVLAWHGIGKTSIPKLKLALANENLNFKTK
jgi:uncharacterized protein YdhG (YjbR/CyaY superfamily)